MAIPFTRPPEWPPMRPGRLAATIEQWTLASESHLAGAGVVALLGLPDDTGVRLNGGRPGAAEGPRAFRAALASFGGTFDLGADQSLDVRVLDAGDVVPADGDDEAALLETHARVEAAARALHQAGCVTVAIGGGHDLALPCIAAWAKHRGQAVGGINLDAHLDVRERIGSGMPFRRLITGGHVDPRAFVEWGLGRFANDRGDVTWARAQGATLVLADDVWGASEPSPSPSPSPSPASPGSAGSLPALLEQALAPGAGFVSIDLDGIDAAFAPGVSAPSPLGLGVGHAARLAEMAGRDPRVGHFDIMELCPPHDQQGRTARVAALLFLSFLAGVRARPA